MLDFPSRLVSIYTRALHGSALIDQTVDAVCIKPKRQTGTRLVDGDVRKMLSLK